MQDICTSWHLGFSKKEYTPLFRGFDTFFGFYNGMIDYFDHTHFSEINNTNFYGIDLHDGESVAGDFQGRFATDVFTERAIAIVEQHNASQPLFLYMSHLAVHTGNQFASFQALPQSVAMFKYIEDIKRRTYAGSVAKLDESVGQLFRALDEKGMLNNSIIIFSSDNGGPTYDPLLHAAASNWPLRGQKMQLWEGGVRVPALVWSPLLQLQEPRTSDMLMHISDWLPTLYYAAGGDLEDLGRIDGINMWSHLVNNTPSPRTEVLLNIDQIYGMSALRLGDYKVVRGSFPEKPDIWYGPSGHEELTLNDTMDEWVWKNGSEVRDVLMKNGWWLLTEPDKWRENLTIKCQDNDGTACDPNTASCLFNVVRDPCERDNLADNFPKIVEYLNERIQSYEASAMEPYNPQVDSNADPTCHGFAYVSWQDDEEVQDSECFDDM